MRKDLMILLVLLGVFLSLGCAGNKNEVPNNTVTPDKEVTPVTDDNRDGMMGNRDGMMDNRTGMMDNRTGMMNNTSGMMNNTTGMMNNTNGMMGN